MFLLNARKVTKAKMFHASGEEGMTMENILGNTLKFRWLGFRNACAYVEKRSGMKVADLGRGT
jgi:hypothetical protein